MKVILSRDVKGVGRTHEEVTTADGYALNYLIPGKFAVPATPVARQEALLRRKKEADRAALDSALLAQSIASLASARIVLKVKANEKGNLYDAVGESEIRFAVKEQARIDLPEGVIRLEKPLKKLGAFDVPVATAGAFGTFPVVIEAE